MFVTREVVSLTTNSSGDATGYTGNVEGRVLSVIYTKNDFASGVDFTITVESTQESILALTDQNSSGVWYPRSQVHGSTGTGLTYDGTRTICEPVTVANSRIKVVVAQGGDTKSGTVTVLVG